MFENFENLIFIYKWNKTVMLRLMHLFKNIYSDVRLQVFCNFNAEFTDPDFSKLNYF